MVIMLEQSHYIIMVKSKAISLSVYNATGGGIDKQKLLKLKRINENVYAAAGFAKKSKLK